MIISGLHKCMMLIYVKNRPKWDEDKYMEPIGGMNDHIVFMRKLTEGRLT